MALRVSGAVGWVLLAGCASPGRPLPPSLKLPALVADLRAERVGDTVELHWTTPSASTDGVTLRGAVMTELCRDAGAGARERCTPVRRWATAPGATTEMDALPATLTQDAPGLLVYRVRLLGASGMSAGLSNRAEAASGQAPAAVTGLVASPGAGGVRLRWQAAAGPGAMVELVRTEAEDQGTAPTQVGLRQKRGGTAANEDAHAPKTERLRVDAAESGQNGALDRTAQRDHQYRYVAVRVRAAMVDGHELQLRGTASAAAVVTMRDLLPPAAPRGLVAAADGLTVDLSWEPDEEADLAGYRVYRGEGAATAADSPWQPRTEKMLLLPGFRDTVPHSGVYVYRVTAVDGSGNESGFQEPVRVEVGTPPQP